MKKSKATKRTLLLSVLAMLLCMVMLVGTTFAWFTDSASTAVNKIQAGTLDIALEMKDASGNWVTAEGETLSFKKAADAPAGEEILWEPGATYALPAIKIVNNGNLWLKYKVEVAEGITKKGQETSGVSLLDAIDFYVFDNGENIEGIITAIAGGTAKKMADYFAATNADGEDNTKTLAPNGGETSALTIVGHMKETAGNEYQGLKLDGVAITVLATQYTKEHDSYTDQYDEDATYPVAANTQAELNDVIASAQSGSAIPTKVVLPAGNFKLENETAKNKNITISGTKDTVVTVVGDTGNQLNYQNGATLAFEGVTIHGQPSGNYGGIAHVAKTTFTNCTFEGKLTLYGDATFINCTFNNKSDYAIWTWGAKNAEFIGCTFESGGKALLLYGGAGSTETPTTNLTVTDCVFNDDDTLTTEKKAAIEIGNDYNAVYNLTVNNITVNGFTVNPAGISTGSTTWANKNSMDQAHLNVVIDGVDVY